MSTFWRQAGLNYIQFSNICAKVVRRSLKPEFRSDAEKRGESIIKSTKWTGGKAEVVAKKVEATAGGS